MEPFKVTDEEFEATQKYLSEIADLSIEDLVNKEAGKGFDFEDLTPLFEKIKRFYGTIQGCSMESLPRYVIIAVMNGANKMLTTLGKFKHFTAQRPNPMQERQTQIDELVKLFTAQYQTLAPAVSFILWDPANTEMLRSEATEKAQKILAQMDSMHSEAEATLLAVRKAAGSKGIERHAGLFKEEADKFRKSGNWWLGVTIAIALALLYFAYWNIDYYSTTKVDITVARSIQLGLAKVIGFSILYFGLILASRNYRALRHNYVVNKHRVNALSTFEAFVQSTKHVPTQNAVLIRSTETIFSPSPTGYLGKEEERSGNTRILEIVREALGKSSE